MASGLVFFDGFEIDRSLQGWDGSSGASTSASYARYGGAGLRLSGNAPYVRYYITKDASTSTVYIGFAMFPSLTYNFWDNLLRVFEDGVQHVRITRGEFGRLDIYGAADTLLGHSGSNLVPAGAWSYVEFKIVIHDTTGSVTIRQNGVLVASVTNVDTRGAGTTGIADELVIGKTFVTTSSIEAYFDDLYIADGAVGGSDFQGDVIIRQLAPTSDDSIQWTPSTGTTNYTLIDEVPPSESDYIKTSSTGQRDVYGLDNSPYDSQYNVLAVRQVFVASKTDQAVRKARTALIDGGNEHTGTTRYLAASPEFYQQVHDARPGGGGNWNVTALDALKVAVETVA